MTRRGVLLRVSILAVAIVVFIVLETRVGMPSGVDVRGYFSGLGWTALPAFAVFYAAATLLPLPKAVCTIAGGAVFGFFAGSRWLGRSSVRGLNAERLRRLDGKIGERGFTTVLVARLVPVIPFTTLNYIFGLSAVSLRSYVGATAIGIVPGTAVYVAVGAYGFSPGSWPFAIAVAGVVVLSLIGIVRSRRTRSAAAIGAPRDAPTEAP